MPVISKVPLLARPWWQRVAICGAYGGLASALAVLTGVGVHDAGSGPTFSCAVEWVVVYPAGPASHRAVFPINVAGTTTGAQKRAALAAEVRTHAVEFLQARGFDLPGERIDVALV